MILVCDWCNVVIEGGSVRVGEMCRITVCDTCADKHWQEINKKMMYD